MTTRARKTTLAVAVLAVVVASPAPAAMAQAEDPEAGPTTPTQQGPRVQPATPAPHSISGRVQSVTADRVTLTDGTQLILLPGFPVRQDQLKPGATIKASYAETAGHKVATSIELEPPQ